MSSSEQASTAASSAEIAWQSLVKRSAQAWEPQWEIIESEDKAGKADCKYHLERCSDLKAFLREMTTGMAPIFWFFQKRDWFLAQNSLTKWNPNDLDQYVLFPAGRYVTKEACLFMSHFWHTKNHPDPARRDLQLVQAQNAEPDWSYIWVDYTCMPQEPRESLEDALFLLTLQTIPSIVGNCSLTYFYPPFEPRLWILSEVAMTTLTSRGGRDRPATNDMSTFFNHVEEMVQTSVASVLGKYSYRCSHTLDRAFLTSWLEFLVILARLNLNILTLRNIMEQLSQLPYTEHVELLLNSGVVVKIKRFGGTFSYGGASYSFTPFPRCKPNS